MLLNVVAANLQRLPQKKKSSRNRIFYLPGFSAGSQPQYFKATSTHQAEGIEEGKIGHIKSDMLYYIYIVPE